MHTLARRVIVCGSCGGRITLYEVKCPYCGNTLEPLGDTRHILPHTTDNPYAAGDAKTIKPHLDWLGEFNNMYPDLIDDLIESVIPLRDHKYPYREYIIDLLSLISHYRSTCLNRSNKTRELHLEIYKRLDAIYNSLTGTSVY